jgi:outer membrane lipoprotein-sorting protein
MQKISVLALALAFSFNAQGQKDTKSQDILKGVSAKYKSYKSLSASFKITIENLKDKSKQTEKGTILIAGSKYNLSITGQQIMSDGKTAWTYLKDANEVQVNDATAKTDGLSPTTIFTIYETGFDTRYAGEKTVGGNTLQQIDLTPLDKKKPYFKVELQINKVDKNIVSAKVLNNNGTHLTYAIEKFTANPPTQDSQFAFDAKKYPGVEVVDLR